MGNFLKKKSAITLFSFAIWQALFLIFWYQHVKM